MSAKRSDLWLLRAFITSLLLLGLCTACAGQPNAGPPSPTQIDPTAIASLQPATLSPTPPPPPTETAKPTDTPHPSVTPKPSYTATPHPSVTPTSLSEMVLVPAGSFQMGNDAANGLAECQKYNDSCQRDWYIIEEPAHTVNLSAFYIGRYEVTNAQYAACVQAGVCSPPGQSDTYTRSSYYDNPKYENYPVVYVDWNQAKAYCTWRGARLPTEAEWEYAARGALLDAQYPWGNDEPTCAAANASPYDPCIGDTSAVGSFAPNGYGLYDMAGNVWEWTADWYGDYPSETVTDPTGPSSGAYRIMRGGSWVSAQYFLRVAGRNGAEPDGEIYDVGFRCALDEELGSLLEAGQPASAPLPEPDDTGAALPNTWALTLVNEEQDRIGASAIQALADGSLVMAGKAGESSTLWVLKLNPSDRSIPWQIRLDDFGEYTDIAVAPDDAIYVASTSEKDLGVIKISPEGEVLWQNRYGSWAIERSPVIAATPDGILLAGLSSITESRSLLVYQLDPSGSVNWQYAYTFDEDAPEWDSANLQVLADGGFVVWGRTTYDGGFALLHFDSTGQVMAQASYTWGWGGVNFGSQSFDVDVTAMQYQPKDGSLLVAGITKTTQGLGPSWVIKMNAEGQVIWQVTTSQVALINQIQNSDNGYILAGAASSTKQPWVSKISFDGEILWQMGFNNGKSGSAAATLRDVLVLENGELIAAGNAYCSTSGPDCALLLKMDASGLVAGCAQWAPTDLELNPYEPVPLVVQNGQVSTPAVEVAVTSASSPVNSMKLSINAICAAP